MPLFHHAGGVLGVDNERKGKTVWLFANIEQFGPATESFLCEEVSHNFTGFGFSEMHIVDTRIDQVCSNFDKLGLKAVVSPARPSERSEREARGAPVFWCANMWPLPVATGLNGTACSVAARGWIGQLQRSSCGAGL